MQVEPSEATVQPKAVQAEEIHHQQEEAEQVIQPIRPSSFQLPVADVFCPDKKYFQASRERHERNRQ